MRLKHSLMDGEEINDILPNTLAEFEDAIASGKLKQIAANLDELLGDRGYPARAVSSRSTSPRSL